MKSFEMTLPVVIGDTRGRSCEQ